MNIVKEILKLRRAIRALRPSAGTGMAVEVTPSGTRYSLLEERGGSGGMGWHGTLELVAGGDHRGRIGYAGSSSTEPTGIPGFAALRT